MRKFQEVRGLRTDGVCGRQTWSALVESGYRLGDRLLYRRTPPLRGDDVAELQRHLGGLGFDAGRVDGIFGDRTAQALADFQRNVAVTVDGICGHTTLAELSRLQVPGSNHQLVTGIREREQLRRSPRTLEGRGVAVGHHGGLGATVEMVRRTFLAAGADALALQHPEGSQLAAQANAAGADVYLGLRLEPHAAMANVSYYSGYRYDSPGGRQLAKLVQRALVSALDLADTAVVGMSVPELRETRMPAVVCEIGPALILVERSSELSLALLQGLTAWAGAPWEE